MRRVYRFTAEVIFYERIILDNPSSRNVDVARVSKTHVERATSEAYRVSIVARFIRYGFFGADRADSRAGSREFDVETRVPFLFEYLSAVALTLELCAVVFQSEISCAPMQISMAPDRMVLECGGTVKALVSEAPVQEKAKKKIYIYIYIYIYICVYTYNTYIIHTYMYNRDSHRDSA